ncbi:helix-turn-helix transcriptional regulator [Pseudoalteromonas amylolytica]|uniref:helix-turn-helix transcriptional regulator n=1 Tax=Pseudoalteromonas amylolytica TaxID=1859457 RepID=UPI00308454D4
MYGLFGAYRQTICRYDPPYDHCTKYLLWLSCSVWYFLVAYVQMHKSDRLFQLVNLLKGRRLAITAKQLAERFEVSERTIYRDI